MKPTNILHRAKRIDNGKWVEGYYNTNIDNCNHLIRSPEDGGTVLTENKNSYCSFSGKMYIIDPSTLCVWTTLTDHYANKIFNDDIVIDGENKYVIKWYSNLGRYVAVYMPTSRAEEEGQCKYESLTQCFINDLEIEIIGNIHDNKELIEEI